MLIRRKTACIMIHRFQSIDLSLVVTFTIVLKKIAI